MAKKSVQNKIERQVEKSVRGMSPGGIAVLLLVLAIVAFGIYVFSIKPPKRPTNAGDLTIHLLTLGNGSVGDCIFIQAGDNDILVDAGSTTSSIPTITAYIDEYVTDNTLEYVIVTHAHQDHYAGFTKENGSIFDLYTCENIIDFALTNSTAQMYGRYISERQAEINAGAKHYTAADCINGTNGGTKTFDLGNNIELEILKNKYYFEDAHSENDYSVCFTINQGNKKFLFTGDLESGAERYLVDNNDIGKVEFYKAGHHGSKTSSSAYFMQEIKPNYVGLCTVAGTDEYDVVDPLDGMISQSFIDNVAPHTTQVYATSIMTDTTNNTVVDLNGNIVVTSTMASTTINCSNNNTLLKDTDWLKNNRNVPTAWA